MPFTAPTAEAPRGAGSRARGTGAAPEACYWAGVSAYKGSNDATHLGATARQLKEQFPESEWTRKSSVWLQ